MKQFNKSIDFSGYPTSKSAFAVVDSNPQNNPDAFECHGYTCYNINIYIIYIYIYIIIIRHEYSIFRRWKIHKKV